MIFRFHFLSSINTDRSDLFSFVAPMPTSFQKLINVKPPCLRYDIIYYKFLGESYSILNQQICINGRFFKDFARAVLEGADKSFSKISSIKNELVSDMFKVEYNLKKLKEDYK